MEWHQKFFVFNWKIVFFCFFYVCFLKFDRKLLQLCFSSHVISHIHQQVAESMRSTWSVRRVLVLHGGAGLAASWVGMGRCHSKLESNSMSKKGKEIWERPNLLLLEDFIQRHQPVPDIFSVLVHHTKLKHPPAEGQLHIPLGSLSRRPVWLVLGDIKTWCAVMRAEQCPKGK